MTNPRIVAILRQVVEEGKQEDRNEKLFLIEDIIKAKRLLFGWGELQHSEFMHPNAAGQLFDMLYDMEVIQLKLIMKDYEKKINAIAKQRVYETD